MTARLRISNRQARWLWLDRSGLGKVPIGPLDVISIVGDLGFVQMDTLRVVVRAHDHILWSRNQNYREGMLHNLLEKRHFFEHFTHDASILPMGYLPIWRRQFARQKARLGRISWWHTDAGAALRQSVRRRIADEGPLSARDFGTHGVPAGLPELDSTWVRSHHKLALDFMWYEGALATSYRRDFIKYYDLAERVFPADEVVASPEMEQIDRLCRDAHARMGIATAGDIQRFFDAVTNAEARDWVAQNQSDLTPVTVETAEGGWVDCWAPGDIEVTLNRLCPPTSRLRILSPFDPAIRDRDRLKRLFGFDYRIEIFVPKAKRRWGYYVFPILEGDRMVGRIEAVANRKSGVLEVLDRWAEPGIRWGENRQHKLEAELGRLAKLAGVETVSWR